MSTLKTLLMSASVLLLGASLLGLGTVAWVEQQEIQVLEFQMASTQADIVHVREQADSDTARLDRTIKTANKNFIRLDTREYKLADAVVEMWKFMISSSGQQPSSYNPNLRGE